MTFAWYGHLKNMKTRHWYLAALLSWGISLFEYLIQVPANRFGSHALTVGGYLHNGCRLLYVQIIAGAPQRKQAAVII
jgi:uncharacterized protein (DUF486 family)